MSRYRLIFEGRISPQAEREAVQGRLADLFQVTEKEIASLFTRVPVVLKEDLAYDTALQDKADFEATGALCRLEAHPSASQSDRPTPDRPPAAPHQATSAARQRKRRYGLHHPYLLAFCSRSFYRDVIAHWRGLAFVHLLLLVLLSSAVYTLHFREMIAHFITAEAPAIIAQIPDIMIDGGRVRVTVEEPYAIRHPESGTLLAVIDTTGEISSLEQTEAVLLLTATRLAARIDAGESRVLDLRQIESLRIDQTLVARWLEDFGHWAPFILFPLALGVSFLLRSAQALLYGGIGLALAALHNVSLPYGALVSVAIMAMTPFLLLDAVLLLLDVVLPVWGLVGFLLAMAYMVFGIRAVARG